MDDFTKSKLKDIDIKSQNELINKCWMTHDGMWFYHCAKELGMEKTNKLNKAAIHSLAGIEMQRILGILGFSLPITDFETFKRFFDGASYFVMADFMNISITYPRPNTMAWSFQPGECFAYKGIKRIGFIDEYECGVIYRIKCWLESLGIKHTFNPEVSKCQMHQAEKCQGEIVLDFET